MPQSLLLQWHVTDRCGNACRHCYQGAPVADLGLDALMEILRQFRGLVRQLRNAAPARFPAHINVTGGEPFLREDLFDLLEEFHALRREFSFAILSGGGAIDDSSAARLARLQPGFVQVSIDGMKSTHDGIRGCGDFDRVTAGVRRLKRAGVPVLVSFTARRDNFRELGEVADFAIRLGARRIWSDRFVPVGGAAEQKEMVLTPQETGEYLELLAQAKAKRRLPWRRGEIAGLRALQFLTCGSRPYRCDAGRSLLTVLADGTLAPCRRMPLEVGNLLSEELSSLYFGSALLAELRERGVPRRCLGCFYAGACRGGLACLAHAMTGSFTGPDPGCWRSSSEAAEG